MKKFLAAAVLLLAACQPNAYHLSNNAGAGFWKPVSAPNVMMPIAEAQQKLDYDLSQCRCANFPSNVPTPIRMRQQPDIARLAETARGGCLMSEVPVLTECMRARGWAPTMCSGRLPSDATQYCPVR